jgi:hypothetical protein
MIPRDLIRVVRSGGANAREAAEALLKAAKAGELKPNEVAEVEHLLSRPEYADLFGGQVLQIPAELQKAAEPLRDVSVLAQKTHLIAERAAVASRFAADVVLVQEQILDSRLPPVQQGERLLRFFSAYAARFVELSEHEPDEKRASLVAQFEKPLTESGFKRLRDKRTGMSGILLAKRLLEARNTQELNALLADFQIEVPDWPVQVVPERPREEGLPVTPQSNSEIEELQINGPQKPNAGSDGGEYETTLKPDPRRSFLGGTDFHERDEEDTDATVLTGWARRRRRLGGNVLWNVLHLFRDGDSEAATEEALNKLILSAGLLLLFVAVMTGVLLLVL